MPASIMPSSRAVEPATLKGGLSRDGFLGARVVIAQPAKGSRASIDAVFLAAAIAARSGERTLEAGSGTGVAALCLAHRLDGVSVTGLEIDPALCALARENIAANGLASRVRVVEGDVTAGPQALDARTLPPESFDHVFANPPFHNDSDVRLSPNPAKRAAAAHGPGDLDRWLRFLARMVKPGGTLTMIYRADGLARLLAALEGRFGRLVLLPLHPRAGAAANRIIVQGKKASRAPLTLLPGFVVHDDAGSYSAAAEKILRHGAPLAMTPAP